MSDQPLSVDQSDRIVPINLRQSGRTPTELLPHLALVLP